MLLVLHALLGLRAICKVEAFYLSSLLFTILQGAFLSQNPADFSQVKIGLPRRRFHKSHHASFPQFPRPVTDMHKAFMRACMYHPLDFAAYGRWRAQLLAQTRLKIDAYMMAKLGVGITLSFTYLLSDQQKHGCAEWAEQHL